MGLPKRLSGLKGWMTRPRYQGVTAYLLLAPALLITIAVIAYPIAFAFDLSLKDIRLTEIGLPKSRSLDNYARMLASREFWRSSWITLKLVAIVTTGSFALGTATALLVNQKFKGRRAARVMVALPWAVPAVVASITWWWMFDSSFGLINWLLVKAHIIAAPVSWFSEPTRAFIVICVVMIWKGYPFISVMILAGLQAVSTDLYEAAEIDGAGSWAKFRYVTMPGIRQVRAIALILVILWVFRDFPIIWLLTGGGPIGSTRTLAIQTYEQAFGFFNIGAASAIGMVTLVVSLVVSIFMLRRMSNTSETG